MSKGKTQNAVVSLSKNCHKNSLKTIVRSAFKQNARPASGFSAVVSNENVFEKVEFFLPITH